MKAVEGKDRRYMEFLPSPYVSALMDDCIRKARYMTRGGAKYDFTSIIGRRLGTIVDSLLAIKDSFLTERR